MNIAPEPSVDADMVPTERVAVVTFMLVRGHRLTTAEVGVLAGIKRGSAWAMLSKMARVLPLAGPEASTGKRWYLLPDEDDA